MDTEQEIIRLFFRKDRQERLYWELSGKKRSEFFWHLAGTRELKSACLHDLAGDKRPLKQLLRQSGAGENVYFLGSSHIGPTSLEDALHRACDKFDARFRRVEESAERPLAEYSEEELLALWKKAKQELS